MSIKDYEGIIIEALEDYKRWFNDSNEPSESDIEKIKEIDEAINEIQNNI